MRHDWSVGSAILYAIFALIALVPLVVFVVAVTRTVRGEPATEWWIGFGIWIVGISVWWSGGPLWIAAAIAVLLLAGGAIVVSRRA